MSSKQTISYQDWKKEAEKNRQLKAAKLAILNSHYGIDPKPVFDCCGHVVWYGAFEDIFPKVVREKVIDYAIKEGLTDDPGVSGGIAALKEYDRWCEKMLGPKRVKAPDVFCVSTANSDDALHRYMMNSLQELEENLKVKKYLFDTPKFVISGDYISFEWLNGNPNLGFTQPYCKIELNNEKEKEKMEAKKCERCGKLYELEDASDIINVYLPGLPVKNSEKENYTESRIKRDHTFTISTIKTWNSKVIDLCPECREKLKNFFESGVDRRFEE